MFDIVALGELLVDFTESGKSKGGMRLFEQNPGGAPCNMLSCAVKQGCSAAFVGKVGDDMHGAFLKDTLQSAGISVQGLVTDKNVFTTLAFVALAPDGEREFSFARKPGADAMLTKEDVDEELLKSCRMFHFGSVSLSEEPAREATLSALETAKKAGAVISYDPNYRAPLWQSAQEARQRIRVPLRFVDMIKLSSDETEIVTGEKTAFAAAAFLHQIGIRCVVVTMQKMGAYVSLLGQGEAIVPGAPDLEVVDKTGAGDAFWGAFCAEFLRTGGSLDELSIEKAASFARYANAAATLCISKRGGIPAMPIRAEVETFLQKGRV